MKKKSLYPGVAEVEEERVRAELARKYKNDGGADFVGGKPNYEKFNGWSPEKVLVWLNID